MVTCGNWDGGGFYLTFGINTYLIAVFSLLTVYCLNGLLFVGLLVFGLRLVFVLQGYSFTMVCGFCECGVWMVWSDYS